jgi:hypothetical protein
MSQPMGHYRLGVLHPFLLADRIQSPAKFSPGIYSLVTASASGPRGVLATRALSRRHATCGAFGDESIDPTTRSVGSGRVDPPKISASIHHCGQCFGLLTDCICFYVVDSGSVASHSGGERNLVRTFPNAKSGSFPLEGVGKCAEMWQVHRQIRPATARF